MGLRGEKNLYRAAVLCAIAPLTAGLTIFILWLFGRDIYLVSAGLKTIEHGKIAIAMSLALLLGYAVVAHRNGGSISSITRKSLKPLAIITMNFVAAAILFISGAIIATSFVITVVNSSESLVEGFHLLVPDDKIRFGNLQPSDSRTEWFRIRKDGNMEYRFRKGETCYSGMVEGYVTNMQGGKIIITVGKDGRIEILDEINDSSIESIPSIEQHPQGSEGVLPCMIPG